MFNNKMRNDIMFRHGPSLSLICNHYVTFTYSACQLWCDTVALFPISTYVCYLFPKLLLTWQCEIGSFPALLLHILLDQAAPYINAHTTPVT